MNPPPRTLGVQSKFRTLIKKKEARIVDQRFYYVVSVMREGNRRCRPVFNRWHRYTGVDSIKENYILIIVNINPIN